MTAHRSPAGAADDAANFVVDRENGSSLGTDTNESGRRAGSYDSLFRDGFEGSDAVRRSATVP